MLTADQTRCQALRRGYIEARAAGATRHRDIAASLKVSEGELIAAHSLAPPVTGLAASAGCKAPGPHWSLRSSRSAS